MSNRGGKREGAGRKKGSANVKSSEIAAKALEQGVSPLEIMLGAARELWTLAQAEPEAEKRIPLMQAASAEAARAAPFVHPRLQTIEHTGANGGPIQTEAVSDMDTARRIAFILSQAANQNGSVARAATPTKKTA